MELGATPDPRPRTIPPWYPKALAVTGVAVIIWLGVYALLGQIRSLIIWLLVSLFLSFAIEPAVNFLARHGWRRGLGAALVLFGALAAVAVVVAFFARSRWRTLENPAMLLRRRVFDHLEFWRTEILAVDDAVDADERRASFDEPRGSRPSVSMTPPPGGDDFTEP